MKQLKKVGAVVVSASIGVLVFSAPMTLASSKVNVGGRANCRSMVGGTQAAKKVTIKEEGNGESHSESTGMWNDTYRMTFSWMPAGGTWAQMTVNCGALAVSPGDHSKRVWLKPDWRNTTGDTSWTSI